MPDSASGRRRPLYGRNGGSIPPSGSALFVYSARHRFGKAERGSKPQGAPFHARLAQRQGNAFRPHPVGVQISGRVPCPCSPTAEANRSKRYTVRVQITPRVPLHARLAQRQSGGPTNLRSGFRNSHRVPSCACISVAENAADNRGTQVRFLTGAPTQGTIP